LKPDSIEVFNDGTVAVDISVTLPASSESSQTLILDPGTGRIVPFARTQLLASGSVLIDSITRGQRQRSIIRK
jgi:hypothetical protein